MTELLFKDKVFKMVGSAMEAHRVLGPGFLEAVYQEALAIEFKLRNMPTQNLKISEIRVIGGLNIFNRELRQLHE